MMWLRNFVFTVGYILGTVVVGLASALVLRFLSYNKRAKWLLCWNRWTLWLAKICCGVKWEIINPENIASVPSVYLSNHESQGETYFLQLHLRPVSTVLKQELLDIPFFGLGLRLVEPIAIDRGSPKLAVKKMLLDGVKRLESGLNVLIYPQGTRKPFKAPVKYSRGGAAIAVEAKAQLIPIAHNAETYWPAKGFKLRPGTISVIIGAAIDTTQYSAREASNMAAQWTQEQLEQLKQEK